jgi:hypothetical protein
MKLARFDEIRIVLFFLVFFAKLLPCLDRWGIAAWFELCMVIIL